MFHRKKIICSALLFIVILAGLFLVFMRLQKGAETPDSLADNTAQNATSSKPEKNTEPLPDMTEPTPEPSLIDASGMTLETRIHTPAGYERTPVNPDSLAHFLRNYRMKKDGKPVCLYDGSQKGNQDAHAAVFKLPIEKEDLQQCADSIMRVYAEYFWHTGQKERIAFHLVGGFYAEYSKWRAGYRMQISEQSTHWVKSAAADDSYEIFQKYMRIVFAYAGTLSMKAESKKTSLSKLKVGDIFIKDGSPGHVVMVVDLCKNSEGKKAFLLAQGYMPAQDFHVLKNPSHETDPWYYEEEVTYPFTTPEYTFEKGSLRRLRY